MNLTFIPKIEQLSSRVIRILGCNPGTMTLQGTNTYLVGQGSKRILIDTSGGETIGEYIDLLRSELETRNVQLQEILISHWHSDHTGGSQEIFKSITNGPIKVSKHKIMDSSPEPDEATKYTYITDNHVIKTEGATLRAIYTPGHTNDHLSFYLDEENALFSGDCILGETSAEFEDLYEYMNSLRRIFDIGPALIYPGHGPLVTNGVERIKEYIEHRTKRNNQILDVLKSSAVPLEPEELVRTIYVGLDENLIPAACFNVSNHLSALLKQSLVAQTSEDKWIYARKE